MFALSALLSGCGGTSRPASNTVRLTGNHPDQPFIQESVWQADNVFSFDDPRGQHELLAEDDLDDPATSSQRALYVKILWPIPVGSKMRDKSTLNARIGWLLRNDPGTPAARSLYYEGTGHVFADQAWWGGRRQFHVRHAVLRLTRVQGEQVADPLGTLEVQADLIANVDPRAEQNIQAFFATVGGLKPYSAESKPERP